MNSRSDAINETGLSAELQALLSQTPPTSESEAVLKANFKDFDLDPDFVADFLKAQFVEDVYRAMAVNGINKTGLSRRLGKTRQYVGRILNETANFTFRTVAEIASALGWRAAIRIVAPDEHLFVVPTVTKELLAVDILSAFQMPSSSVAQPACHDYVLEPIRLSTKGSENDTLEIAA